MLLRQELPNGDSSEAGQRVQRSQLVNGLQRLDSSCIELLDVSSGWFGKQPLRLWTPLGRSGMGVAVMPASQPTRYLLNRVAAYGVSATGDPYADLVLIHPQGGTCKAKAFSSCFGDLNELHAYEGAEVNVLLTSTGLQLRPMAEQTAPGLEDSVDLAPEQGLTADRSILNSDCAFFSPEAEPSEPPSTPGNSTLATVQEVAATVARLARDFELPTVMWVHLPIRHDRSLDRHGCPKT